MEATVLQWDRNDTESRHLAAYVLECIKQNKPPIITIMVAGGKIVGELVEMGTYVYVVDWKDHGHTKRSIVHKSNIAVVLIGEY